MESILAMVEEPSTSEITSFDQIDQNLFQELLAKCFVWDFYETSRDEYMSKDDGEKKSLIFKSYNHMAQGKVSLFASFSLSGFCVSDIELVFVLSMFSSMMRFSPVVFSVSLSEYKFCSVFDALFFNDCLSEVKLSSE